MDIFSIFTLCGGLAFFLYGLGVMSQALEKIAGGKLERILKKMTSNPLKGFIFGAGITAAIQSSSAVTVMLIGLVNSGIMNLSQTVSVIIGSNVGTTMTAWLISLSGIQGTTLLFKFLKPESFSPLLAFIGVLMIFMSKSAKRKNLGTVFISFAILMFGMELMSGAMAPLADMPGFRQVLLAFTNPILGMLVGLVVTMLIQSSSASIGILQALTMVGGVTYNIAIPILLGQNLGTCISALLGAIGVNTNAKRVAGIHIIYNILSVGLCLPLFILVNSLIDIPILSTDATPFGIAVVHTVYNIITALIFFPLCKLLEHITIKVIPDRDEMAQSVFIDERLLLSPSFAISECYEKTKEMAELVKYNIKYSTKLLKSFHKKNAEHIAENEVKVDKYEDKLNSFLLKLSTRELSEEDSNRVSQLLLTTGDYERMGDHASYILKIAEKLNDDKKKFSEDAVEELKILVKSLLEIYDMSFEAYQTDNSILAQEVEPLEAVIKKNVRRAKNNHIQRLKEQHCSTEVGIMFLDLLNDIRRIAAHCGNIATSVMQLKDRTLDKHEYNHRNKQEDLVFTSKYQDYKSRYRVDKKYDKV